jgi:hypothetical protein
MAGIWVNVAYDLTSVQALLEAFAISHLILLPIHVLIAKAGVIAVVRVLIG